jgi:hypothetical protein
VLATAGAPIHASFDELRSAARALKADTGLNLLPTVAGMVAMYGSGGADILL